MGKENQQNPRTFHCKHFFSSHIFSLQSLIFTRHLNLLYFIERHQSKIYIFFHDVLKLQFFKSIFDIYTGSLKDFEPFDGPN